MVIFNSYVKLPEGNLPALGPQFHQGRDCSGSGGVSRTTGLGVLPGGWQVSNHPKGLCNDSGYVIPIIVVIYGYIWLYDGIIIYI